MKHFNEKISIPLEIEIKGKINDDDMLEFDKVKSHGYDVPDWLVGLLEDEYYADIIDELSWRGKL